MKSNDELDKVELPALHQLQQLGWQYIPGALLSPESSERDYLRDVVLVNRLNASCLLYTSPSPRDATLSRMPSSA